ncbi:MAG TPA: DUF6644 family protein [Hyphomonadaceae bacterium]|nr:DUF6644 family protein [Hyphomonadaceae bacterium]
MNFQQYLPGLQSWIETLPLLGKTKLLFGVTLLDIFALFGGMHLVGMALIGGCTILINVRFMGAGVIDATPQSMWKSLRPWVIVGVVLAIFSGLIMGALTASKLFQSNAFFAKMMALAAALIFSFGVTGSIARHEGKVSRNALIATVVALLLWVLSLFVFGSTEVTNVGLFHVVTACFAIVLVFGANQTRIIAAATYGVLYGGTYIMYWIVGFNSFDQIYLDIARYAVILGFLVVAALLFLELRKNNALAASGPARMIALFSILTWVTVAAGGRWIGFSP